MKKHINANEFRSIIWAHVMNGKSMRDIATETGRSKTTVVACCRAFLLLRDGNTEELIRMVNNGYNNSLSDPIIKLAAETLGIEVPADVAQAMAERRDAALARRVAKNMVEEAGTTPVAEETEDTSSAAEAAPSPKGEGKAQAEPKGNDALYFIRILEELHEQNQLLRDLLDVVIPKWAGDLKDNQNANSDVLAGLLREQGQALDAIRCNTRKRGL